jgi:hypothetical protein
MDGMTRWRDGERDGEMERWICNLYVISSSSISADEFRESERRWSVVFTPSPSGFFFFLGWLLTL